MFRRVLSSSASWIFLAVVASGAPAAAQGILIDRRPHIPIARTYEVREVSIDARVRDQVAEVQVSQTFANPGSATIEAEFLFPLPDESAISNLVLIADGQEIVGRVLPKDEARRIYEDIVRSKRDPALVEYIGRGLFRTSVFPIPPRAERKVTLRYTQLLRRDGRVVELAYPLGTQKYSAKPIQRLEIRARIESKDPIKSVYSPTNQTTVRRLGDREAVIELSQRDAIPEGDFRVLYTLAEGEVGASVVSYRSSDGDDGYFLLLASPAFQAAEPRPRAKTVLFVVDRSGSMAGKKIEQARESLKFCLDNLREDDTFNIIAFDDRVELFKPELQRYRRETREEAIRFVDNLRPGGSTNIHDALITALDQLQGDSTPRYLLFLTDGLPTAGPTSEGAIVEAVKRANRHGARLFVFGVGFDVNARLLDRLSSGNGGTSEYVKPDENIESKVASFYSKLTAPVLTGIRVSFEGTDINRVYPRDIPDLFEGGQITLVGRYRQSGRTTVRLTGQVGGERKTFEFSADLASSSKGSSYDFIPRLWAVRRVGAIIDQIDLQGSNRELTEELVELSKRYGILTPYTSFLAEEGVRLHAAAENVRRAEGELRQLSEVQGRFGVGQRDNKARYQSAERLDELSAASAVPAADRELARQRGAIAGGAGAARPMSPGGSFGYGGLGLSVAAKDVEGKDRAVTTVRNVAGKTFFLKGDAWVDSTVTPEDEAKARTLEQFSEDYFQVVRAQTPAQNQYLAFADRVVVKINGAVYRIVPPKQP